MKKTRRRYDRELKISVVSELESGKPLAQIACKHSIHPGLPCRWRDELAKNPEKNFQWKNGNGNKYKDEARIEELERLLGQESMPRVNVSLSDSIQIKADDEAHMSSLSRPE